MSERIFARQYSDDPEREYISRELGRRSLIDFTTYTYPKYNPEEFHVKVAEEMMGVLSGDIRRLILIAPPQHGKSELVSVRFPAFWMAKRPDDPIILCSYGSALAQAKAGGVSEIRGSLPYYNLFPDLFNITKTGRRVAKYSRGKVTSAGVGGPITGFGGALGIIDDPVKNYEEAYSPGMRDKAWKWWQSTFRTRIWDYGAIIVIMCMTGDTGVLMSDGVEKPLREIMVGDKVASYHEGRLVVSRVKNWKNQGLDYCYAIKTNSGRMVKANARHPFLINRNGVLEWVRLRDLKVGDKMICHEARGQENSVQSKDVENQLNVRGSACLITTKIDGPEVFDPRLSTTNQSGLLTSNIDTKSPLSNTKLCSRFKTVSAPYADDLPQKKTRDLGQAPTCALTTTTQPEKLEGYSATIAMLALEGSSHPMFSSPLLSTYESTTDEIISIEPIGEEEVFDVEIEGTGNFIANGCTSHNTRWHEDDLVGRILNTSGENWKVMRFPAICEEQSERDEYNLKYYRGRQGEKDPLDRKPMGPLCPIRYPLPGLLTLKHDVGQMAWYSEYQGAPRPAAGQRILRSWVKIMDDTPRQALKRIRYWDKAGSKDGGAYTAGVLMCVTSNKQFYIENVVRGQWGALEREQVIRDQAIMDKDVYGQVDIWVEQEPGSGGLESAENTIRNLAGFVIRTENPRKDKNVRFEPFAVQCEAGNVFVKRARWNWDYLEEIISIPSATFRDQADASAGAFNKLTEFILKGASNRIYHGTLQKASTSP